MNKQLFAKYFLLIGATATATTQQAASLGAALEVGKDVAQAAGAVKDTIEGAQTAAQAATFLGKIVFTFKAWSNWGMTTLYAGKEAVVSFVYAHPVYATLAASAACGAAGAIEIQKRYFPTTAQLRQQALEANMEVVKEQLYTLLCDPARFNYSEVQVLALSLGVMLTKQNLLEQHGTVFIPVKNWLGIKKVSQDTVDALNIVSTYKNGGIIENALIYDAYLKAIDVLREYCAPSFWRRARNQMALYGIVSPATPLTVLVVREGERRAAQGVDYTEMPHLHFEEMTLDKLQQLTQKEIRQFIDYLERKLTEKTSMTPRDLTKYSTYETLLRRAKQLLQK